MCVYAAENLLKKWFTGEEHIKQKIRKRLCRFLFAVIRVFPVYDGCQQTEENLYCVIYAVAPRKFIEIGHSSDETGKAG